MTWFPSGLNDASSVESVIAGFTLKVAIWKKEGIFVFFKSISLHSSN
jgi:hypothetical protein